MKKILLVLVLTLLALPHVNYAYTSEEKLTAFDAASGDIYGYSVDIGSTFAVVGSAQDDYTSGSGYYTNVGSVYVYEYDSALNSWQLNAKLIPSDPDSSQGFGRDVAQFGNTIVVGAPGDSDYGGGAGAAYVFKYDASTNTWIEEAKIHGSTTDALDQFGSSVAIYNDLIVVGAHQYDVSIRNEGAVFIYRYNRFTSSWNEIDILTASDSSYDDYFGYDVDIDRKTIVVGSYYDDDFGNASGSVYIYKYMPTSRTWDETKINASDANTGDAFGYAVAINQNNIVVGAKLDDDNGNNSGSAYVFNYRFATATWREVAKLTASDGDQYELFAESVDIYGDTIVIGNEHQNDYGTQSGAAYIYEYSIVYGTKLSTWQETEKIVPTDCNYGYAFGQSVGIYDNRIIAGAYGDDSSAGSISGSSYIYEL